MSDPLNVEVYVEPIPEAPVLPEVERVRRPDAVRDFAEFVSNTKWLADTLAAFSVALGIVLLLRVFVLLYARYQRDWIGHMPEKRRIDRSYVFGKGGCAPLESRALLR